MAREPRDMKPWTFWIAVTAKDTIKTLADEATKQAGRTIRRSAVGRALVNRALADPALVEAAVADAITEPPSGPARKPAPEGG